MLWEEKLIGASQDTVAVAARNAWSEYQMYHAYICQPGRMFQPVQYMAFYAASQIYPAVARILEVKDNVTCEYGRYEGHLGQFVGNRSDRGANYLAESTGGVSGKRDGAGSLRIAAAHAAVK